MSKIIFLNSARANTGGKTQVEQADLDYQAKILGMDKLDLLEEMVRFQEERADEGQLTSQLIARGKVLFKALEESAQTVELRNLARSYRRHLNYEQLSKFKKA